MKRRHALATFAMLATVTLGSTAFADPPQTNAPPTPRTAVPDAPHPIYRFEFTVRRADDAPSARPATYTMNLEENHGGTLSVGSNVPLQTASASHPNVAPRQDVGLMLHFNFSMQANNVVLSGTVEISSAEPMVNGVAGIRRFRADGAVPLVPGRAAPFANVTDPATHNTYEISVTATRLQ